MMGEEGGKREAKVEMDMAVSEDFDLERVVCSHGLFMMAPNQWDPATRTFRRPLRLFSSSSSSSSSSSFASSSSSSRTLIVFVHISHPRPGTNPLRIVVSGVDCLSLQYRETLLAQIRRMLRINKEDDAAVREFHQIHPESKQRGFGRVFRSPTLFEDMIKCILLCNCQWSRTLSMARALCELQSEIKEGHHLSKNLQPRTPQKKELRRRKTSLRLNLQLEEDQQPSEFAVLKNSDSDSNEKPKMLESIGDFPIPEELANLDADFLARRCGLGYRAKRISMLAQAIVEKKIQLDELEEACDVSSMSSYQTLNEKLSCLNGFGPFTRANVLMCMGFYHKIPSDSETSRHLRQVHSVTCTTSKMVDEYVHDFYGKYAPFQFLAYWSELWDFYEQRFGKMSEMAQAEYHQITANNMKDHVLKGHKCRKSTDEHP